MKKRSYCPGTFDLLASKQTIRFCANHDINLTALCYEFMREQMEEGNLCTNWPLQFHRYVITQCFFGFTKPGFISKDFQEIWLPHKNLMDELIT